MAPSGFDQYHGMSLEDAQAKCITRRHPHTMGDDSCTWFGVISSTASAVGSVIESKRMLRDGSVHQETFGGYSDGDWGMMARRKLSKLAQIIFNNQQRLVVALEGSGGVAQMGGDDD